jgi:hypothetical protein
MNESRAPKQNGPHNPANTCGKDLSALRLKIMQTEQDQDADAARIENCITSAEQYIAFVAKRQIDAEDMQKALRTIRDRAVLSLRDVRKNMHQRAARSRQIQNWLDDYLRHRSRFADEEREDAHFRARLIELLARAETSSLADRLREALEMGDIAAAELIRFEFHTRMDKQPFMASFEAITTPIRDLDPVEMHRRLANICSAVKNVDARIADLITRSQSVLSSASQSGSSQSFS